MRESERGLESPLLRSSTSPIRWNLVSNKIKAWRGEGEREGEREIPGERDAERGRARRPSYPVIHRGHWAKPLFRTK